MNDDWTNNFLTQQEEEIASILTDSSLYVGMSESDKQTLLRYLVTVYYRPLPSNNSRAHPKGIQVGRTT